MQQVHRADRHTFASLRAPPARDAGSLVSLSPSPAASSPRGLVGVPSRPFPFLFPLFARSPPLVSATTASWWTLRTFRLVGRQPPFGEHSRRRSPGAFPKRASRRPYPRAPREDAVTRVLSPTCFYPPAEGQGTFLLSLEFAHQSRRECRSSRRLRLIISVRPRARDTRLDNR